MIVFPKPPVQVLTKAGHGEAIAYVGESAVVKIDGTNALHFFTAAEMVADENVYDSVRESAAAAQSKSFTDLQAAQQSKVVTTGQFSFIGRGAIVCFRPYSADARRYRVTTVVDRTVRLVDMIDGSKAQADVEALVVIPFQDELNRAVAAAAAAQVDRTDRHGPQAFGKGVAVRFKGGPYANKTYTVMWTLNGITRIWTGEENGTYTDVPSEQLELAESPSPAPPLICSNHVINAEDRCRTCGVSRKAIEQAGETFYMDRTFPVRPVETPKVVPTPPAWWNRAMHVAGEPGTTVELVVKDATGVPIAVEPVNAGDLPWRRPG